LRSFGHKILRTLKLGTQNEDNRNGANEPIDHGVIVPQPKSSNSKIGTIVPSRPTERRQLTVMFCDLVGSTALFAKLDPEDIRDMLRAFLRCCRERIEAGAGFVAQFQGDGVVGYFGYTDASEDSAEQAIRSALDITGQVPKIQVPTSEQLQVRIGISTGIAVVGDPSGEGTRLEQGAVGETLHIAARLQALAPGNGIVIAESTRRLTGRLFSYVDLGNFALKGLPVPVRVWRVMGARRSLSQFKLRRQPLLTQLVGRHAEIEALLHSWRRASAGHGEVVSIIGEAGIGKSRLINEFRHRIARERHLWLEGGGAPSFTNTPFHAIAQAIKRLVDPAGRASPVEFRSRLERALETAATRAEDILQLTVEMFDLPRTDALLPLTIAPDERRARLFSGSIDWLSGTARRRPLVIVAEDLHWFDPSSLELVGVLAERIKSIPALMLCSTRPGFQTGRHLPGHSTEVSLGRLADADLRYIVANIRRLDVSLTGEDVDDVVQRAEGVPLFGIELARFIGEQQVRAGDRNVPPTLSDLLTARLDQLGPAKSVAQVAAVIGDEIPLKLLEAVCGIPVTRFRPLLTILKENDVLREERHSHQVLYAFTHSLLRDAAYDSLLRRRRRELHKRTADALVGKFIAVVASRPELVAYHWMQAGELELAVVAWERAGNFAVSRRAFTEAERAYRKALIALADLGPSPEHDSKALALQSLLADSLRITRGFSAQETVEATARARALADRNGDRAQQFLQMWGQWTAASSGGNHVAAIKLANEFYRLASLDGGTESLAHAHMIQMTSRYRIGDLLGAEDHFKKGEQFFADPDFSRRPGVIAQTYGNAARIGWIIGDDSAAQRRIDHALTVAGENNNPYDLAYADYMAAIHFVLLERFGEAVAFAEGSIRLSDEHAFPQFAAISRVALGRAQVGLGFVSEGATLIREGLGRMADNSVRVALTLYMTWLAEGLLRAELFTEALAAVRDALRANPQELFFRPESLRLCGEILARMGAAGEAESNFLEALALSSRMAARRFRDRATRSLEMLLVGRAA